MKKTQAFVFVLCLTCAPLLLSSGSFAALIVGTITEFTLTSPNPSSGSNALLNLTGITTDISSLPGSPTSVSGSFPTAFLGGFNIGRTPTLISVGGVTFVAFSAGPASTIEEKSITGLPGGGALFELFADIAIVPPGPADANLLEVFGGETLIANSSTLNLSSFSSGQLNLHMETTPGVDLAAVIIGGGTVMGTGTFSQYSTGFLPLTEVPEPSTLMLLGVSIIGLLCCTWPELTNGLFL
jgi:hypothetical protein